jgi:hypothetical protein
MFCNFEYNNESLFFKRNEMHFIMRLRLMTEMYKLQQTLINPFFFEVASHQHWLGGSLFSSKKQNYEL